VVNPSSQEVIAMKKLSVLFLIAMLGIVLWALPAGAEKIRLTDAELDGITAGFVFTTPASIACCVLLSATGGGGAIGGPPPFALATGALTLAVQVPTGTIGPAGVSIGLDGLVQKPPVIMIGTVGGGAFGPKGVSVPFAFGFTFP
jgi:hypothetical protein